jgi:hypothetical protein
VKKEHRLVTGTIIEGKMEQWVTGFLNRMNIPTRKELDEIKERLARLEKAGE